MKPGERIRLITEAAESLNTRPWPTIQLILREHGFKTYEMSGFSGEPDQLGYCTQQIEEECGL
jgi:hypothetical protein